MSGETRTLTIRNVSPEMDAALKREKARRGKSVNQIVLEILGTDLGIREGRRSNGLAELAGVWSEEELEEFEGATAGFEQVDEELWV